MGEKEGVLSRDISLGKISRSYSRANLSNYLIVEHLVEERWEGEKRKSSALRDVELISISLLPILHPLGFPIKNRRKNIVDLAASLLN